MRADVTHFRSEDAGRAVKGGECLIQLNHVPTNGRFSLHQVDLITGICYIQSGLYSSNAPTNNEGVWNNGTSIGSKGSS